MNRLYYVNARFPHVFSPKDCLLFCIFTVGRCKVAPRYGGNFISVMLEARQHQYDTPRRVVLVGKVGEGDEIEWLYSTSAQNRP